MDVYKIYVNDRNYSSWNIFETASFQTVNLQINPAENKLFSNDVFSVDDAKNVNLIHSSVRSGSSMPGVLIISGNKTYGRQQKKNGKLLYKCIPDDMRLPPFLVPYEIKNIGFSKVLKNLYVTITFDNWDDKHPRAKLDNVIGPIDVLDNFYEYQLYCKSLNASIQKFQKDTSRALENKIHENFVENIQLKYPSIEFRTDQTEWNIITIDPPKSLDFDDGFSIKKLNGDIYLLSIYISNVTIMMDNLNLWDSFSRRISTIYLPDKKRPMLPTILSDCLCSLQQNVTRIAFYMDISIKDGIILDIKFGNCLIKVSNNFCYEEPRMLKDASYKLLLAETQKMSKNYKYINSVKNSHDLVCYLMILMNFHSAQKLISHKAGIFRTTTLTKDLFIPDHIPDEVSKFIKIWNSSSGQYINGEDLIQTRHEMLDLDAYIHITSPIRRLVDLLNIIKFQEKFQLISLSVNANNFYTKWINELDYINTTMRAIRKVQCECNLLTTCINSTEVMEKEYDGYMFDKIIRSDGLFQFIVYLPELKLSSRITIRENFDNFTSHKFKLYLFNNEEKFKRKIRLQIC